MSLTPNADSLTANDSPIERGLVVEQNLYYDVHLPPHGTSNAAPPLALVLHGYGGSKRQMMREARGFVPDDFAIAAVQGIHQHIREPREVGAPLRFGFGWLTNFQPQESVALHHQTLLRIIDTLVSENIADRKRVFLVGFSQSVALNYRFALTHTEVLRGVVGICGGLPGDLETSGAYQKTAAAMLHLCGDDDEIYSPARTADYQTRLRRFAPHAEVRHYPQAAHVITDAMRDDLRAWLSERAAS
ncbi:MAG: hypothetical protein MSG64_03320 [Pyrinomonadaceae bacterium MAG19_C2-C3]|nr:hypothetical protein [Pyrinomonadaceae bacterium MAG19_C2-C3]